MFYFQVERDDTGEILAIGKGEPNTSVRTHDSVFLRRISKATYETYQAFDLFPEFEEYEPTTDPDEPSGGAVDYYNWRLF